MFKGSRSPRACFVRSIYCRHCRYVIVIVLTSVTATAIAIAIAIVIVIAMIEGS